MNELAALNTQGFNQVSMNPPQPEVLQRDLEVFDAQLPATNALAVNTDSNVIQEKSIRPDELNLGDRILSNITRLDSQFERLVKNSNLGEKFAQNMTNLKLENNKTDQGLIKLMDIFADFHKQAIETSMWSMQINLVSSGITKSSQGMQTLFRNSG